MFIELDQVHLHRANHRRVCEVVLNGDSTFELRAQKFKVSTDLKTGTATALFGEHLSLPESSGGCHISLRLHCKLRGCFLERIPSCNRFGRRFISWIDLQVSPFESHARQIISQCIHTLCPVSPSNKPRWTRARSSLGQRVSLQVVLLGMMSWYFCKTHWTARTCTLGVLHW